MISIRKAASSSAAVLTGVVRSRHVVRMIFNRTTRNWIVLVLGVGLGQREGWLLAFDLVSISKLLAVAMSSCVCACDWLQLWDTETGQCVSDFGNNKVRARTHTHMESWWFVVGDFVASVYRLRI